MAATAKQNFVVQFRLNAEVPDGWGVLGALIDWYHSLSGILRAPHLACFTVVREPLMFVLF